MGQCCEGSHIRTTKYKYEKLFSGIFRYPELADYQFVSSFMDRYQHQFKMNHMGLF